MSFESKKTTNEKIEFRAHELGFEAELSDLRFENISISIISGIKETSILPNEESLREFHRILGQVLDHVDKQRGVGRDLDG